MARQKHKPQRTCIVCRTVKDKLELIRIVRTPEGSIIVDPTGKANGRGAYICRQPQCWTQNLSADRLAHVLKTTITPNQMTALNEALQTELSKV